MKYIEMYHTCTLSMCKNVIYFINYFENSDEITKFLFYITFILNFTSFFYILDSITMYRYLKKKKINLLIKIF